MQPNNVNILFVDDEEDLVENVRDFFRDYPLRAFTDPEAALKELENEFYDVLVVDYRMPKMNGLDLLLEAKKRRAYRYGILFTAYADKDLLEEVLNRNLVSRVLEKTVLLKTLQSVLDEAVDACVRQKQEENKINGYKEIIHQLSFSSRAVIGLSRGLKTVSEKVQSIARHSVNVLLTGETGTGKEIAAHLIHESSPRKEGNFVKINCAAIPDDLLESELFGHAKGAFTGAVSEKKGKIELAHQGTLFLDEVCEMKTGLQAKLLRVIQEKEMERLGSNKTLHVDFRLISATNRNVAEAVKKGRLREDLFYRINEFSIQLPALRDRKEDIADFIRYFTGCFAKEMNLREPKIEPAVFAELTKYPWPGNIRELENAVRRALIALRGEETVRVEHFHFLLSDFQERAMGYDEALEVIIRKIVEKKRKFKEIERDLIRKILQISNNSIALAVKRTGISKDRFYRNK
jgi:DNA-binding NtrC family response regulator